MVYPSHPSEILFGIGIREGRPQGIQYNGIAHDEDIEYLIGNIVLRDGYRAFGM